MSACQERRSLLGCVHKSRGLWGRCYCLHFTEAQRGALTCPGLEGD